MKKKNSKHLILLHGALGTMEQVDFLLSELKEDYDVHRLNFEGHGESGPTDSPFRMTYFAENVLGYMDEHSINEASFFGYSMGGYVALILAKNHPERVKKVATMGTILQWDEQVSERECRYLYPNKIKEKVPHFAEQLNDRHLSGWERVVNKTRDMLQYLGTHPDIKGSEWKNINCPVRLHVGDRDATAGLAQTIEIYRKIEQSELVVLPKTGHPITEADKDFLILSLEKFLREIKKPDQNDRVQKKNGSKN